ncbi:hypothetical protein [Arcticibacterium luteifluviistationis]|uniref:UspA domain-containing protein n=1 Tax=Arcticibacterium luteifluviistationis TaxID=1784714 RepID=A0A2Z4G897_9BACT|nr:hypothetical protein [Arcticibacterium luteifluviistationis]AWV97366.1 hypothetical protein DJ013_03940 [Arcticibacterium luteifluviistationis]
MVKIAHCTDFSENSKKALETILFNFWSFDITIDILHLVEDSNDKAEEKLKLYKEELLISHSNSVTFSTYLFKSDQKMDLLKKLNTGDYFTTVVGLEGTQKRAGIGSFLEELYKSYFNNLTIIPFQHEIKIENKGLVALEFKNLETLYVLVKISHFLSFQFAKLSILIRVEEPLSDVQLKEVTELIKKVVPSIQFELLVCDHQHSSKYILEIVDGKKLDYCFILKDDFFDSFVYNLIKNKTDESTFHESLIRVSTTAEEVLKIKNDGNSVNRLDLKPQ